jgi:hypothetical protein
VNGGNQAFANLNNQIQNISKIQAQMASAKTPKDAANFHQQLMNAVMQFHHAVAQAHQQAQQQAIQAELQILQQLKQQAQQLQNSIKVVTDKKKVEFHCGDEIVVRNQTLPLEYDDKGKPKKYSLEDVKKLKGPNPNMPGFEAKLEDLQPGTVVKVILAYSPKAGKAPPAAPAKKVAEKKDGADGIVENKELLHRTVVKMILIVSAEEAMETGSMADKKGKK